MADIFRAQTEKERDTKAGGFLDLRTWREDDFKNKMLAKIAETGQEFIYVKREPFSFKAASIALNKKMLEIEQTIQNAISAGKSNIELDTKIDFTKFGGKDKFNFVGEHEIREDQIVQGLKQTVITGKYLTYQCKLTGTHIDIEFSNQELDAKKLAKNVKPDGLPNPN